MNILEHLTQRDILEFGEQINIQNLGTDGDRLFPNMKTDYLEAEYMRLSKSPSLPHAAMVHALDTEAAIGKRPTAEIVRMEQLLIEEKLNVSERINRLMSRGVQNENAILNYIFDDIGNLAMAVRTRTEVAKFETFCTGKMHISENGADLEVDYGVPDSNRYNLDWTATDADIIGDLRTIVTAGKKLGQRYNRAMCSQKVMDMMLQNTAIQKAVNGVYMTGVMITEDGLNTLFNRLFGFTVSVNDDWYEYTKADGTDVQARLFAENKFVLYVGNQNGAVGTGLWGVTPEELQTSGYTGSGYSGFVYITQWTTPDPATSWTKASGMFVPVLPNPKGHVIITIADGTTKIKNIDVTTTAYSDTASSSTVDIYPTEPDDGNSYVYKVASTYQSVSVGDTITDWTTITSGDVITVTTRSYNKITVAEVDESGVVVGVGYAILHRSAASTATATAETDET